MTNPRFFLVFLPSMLSFLPIITPAMSQVHASSQTLSCDRYQEAFTFQIPTYAIKHQDGAILNFKVTYRFSPEAIAKKDYPEFVLITKEIDKYLINYPNETDYWEVVNGNLIKHLLDKYPQMSALNIELGVMPTPKAAFARTSIIRSTRTQGCPIMLGS